MTTSASLPLMWQERINSLPPKRQELIRPVLQEPRDFLFLSIRALAQKLATDTATTLRIVRGLGFSGYPEFRRYLHELSVANITSLDSMLSGSANDSDIPVNVRESLERDQRNLSALRTTLDSGRIAQLAKRIWTARRIIVTGGDLAISLVAYLEHHLTMLGLPVFFATHPGRVVNVVRCLGKKDLLIAFSFHRGLRQTVEGVRQARARRVHCVGICDTFLSPIARFSNECFLASVETRHFGDSYAAPVALLNVILTACANYRRGHTLRLMKDAVQEQKQGYRWFNDQQD